jgi:hypothetical protein
MAKKNIDFGSFPNDPNADAIRIAFQKVQSNFDELYNQLRTRIGVTSLNKIPGVGVTVNQPTGDVILSANIACVQVSTNSLSMGIGANGLSSAVITNSEQVLVIDLPETIPSIGIDNLSVNVTANFSSATNVNLGSVGNVKIQGGSPNFILSTDGVGNLSWINNPLSGIATDVYYVSKSGNDSDDGTTLATAFLTIKRACEVVEPLVNADPSRRVSIFVKAGSYVENNPVTVPKRTAVIGDSLRSVSVFPANTGSDTFYVNNASYVYGFTFRGHISPSAAIAFNPDGSAGAITTSPYIQNCSSITTTGCGVRINGSYVSGLKGMVMDAYTQFNQGGLGVHILNSGYAQLVSIFTICTSYGILCEDGGQCSVTNSNSSFGDFALVADGTSPSKDTGKSNTLDLILNKVKLTNLSARPSVNDVVQFDGDTEYYTILTSTPLVVDPDPLLGNTSEVEFIEQIPNIAIGTDFNIYRRSLISASGHTFEYVGSGTNLATALPDFGGQPDSLKEVVSSNGGKVFITSTDQKGDFKVGADFTINSATGTITGRTFNRSLFSVMTPYILAIT